MDKYVANIKDFVIQALTNGSAIKAKVESSDALSCFQMGMIHLLGIDTSIDFKKASQYFKSQSLSDNQDAIRLLGFIAECEGNYSQAFQYYAKSESSEKDTYLVKAIKGRNHLQDYLRKLNLPIAVNKVISSILNDYNQDKVSRTGASIKLAAICNDEPSCLEAAKYLYESNDYISATYWLKKGQIGPDNSMYVAINDKFEKYKSELLNSKIMQVVDLEVNTLLSNEDPTQYLTKVKESCDDASLKCSQEWKNKSKAYVDAIIKDYKDKEHKAYLQALAEEEARKKRRNNLIKLGAIAIAVLLVILLATLGSSSKDNANSDESIRTETIDSENSNTNTDKVNKSDIQEKAKHNEKSSVNQETDDSGYIPILSERKLSDEDLNNKSKKELELMRNSIYARYGYKFKREDLLNHFLQYSWYDPITSDMGAIYDMMNDNEKYNVDFIKRHE